MKLFVAGVSHPIPATFSALGRAVWDETYLTVWYLDDVAAFSALGRAVWDETAWMPGSSAGRATFSALGRAVWDETRCSCRI